jgi:hypothetical protein
MQFSLFPHWDAIFISSALGNNSRWGIISSCREQFFLHPIFMAQRFFIVNGDFSPTLDGIGCGDKGYEKEEGGGGCQF